jgi:hypothetical protein
MRLRRGRPHEQAQRHRPLQQAEGAQARVRPLRVLCKRSTSACQENKNKITQLSMCCEGLQ